MCVSPSARLRDDAFVAVGVNDTGELAAIATDLRDEGELRVFVFDRASRVFQREVTLRPARCARTRCWSAIAS